MESPSYRGRRACVGNDSGSSCIASRRGCACGTCSGSTCGTVRHGDDPKHVGVGHSKHDGALGTWASTGSKSHLIISIRKERRERVLLGAIDTALVLGNIVDAGGVGVNVEVARDHVAVSGHITFRCFVICSTESTVIVGIAAFVVVMGL